MLVVGLDLPASFDAWELVDWIETSMVLADETSWSRTAILDSFASGAEPDQAELDYAFEEIRRRATVAPNVYPFRIDEDSGVIERDANVDPRVYEFLVIVSIGGAPFRKRNQFTKVNAIFDLLVREALRSYMGAPDAQAVRF